MLRRYHISGVSVRRSVEECADIFRKQSSANQLTDEEVADLIEARHIAARQLEKVVDNMERGVRIRRLSMARTPIQNIPCAIDRIPYESYDYTKVRFTNY